jgi:hypothetical protein
MTTLAGVWRPEGYDVHVVAGASSIELDSLLQFGQDDGKLLGAAPDVTKVEFLGRFAGAPSNFGVTVSTTTGKVTVAKPLPAGPRLRNFILEAVVKVGGTTLDPLPIRVHVHESVKEAWLTPDTLTLHRGADGQRFTLMAKFDDDVIGCLPMFPGVSWLPGVTWTATPASAVTLDGSGGMTANANSGTVTIEATLPTAWGSKKASAQVELKPPWSAGLEPVGTPRGAVEEVPNVLILPEGFTAADQAEFNYLASAFVEKIRQNVDTRPYDILPINFWKAWVESPEAGCSYLNAVYLHPEGVSEWFDMLLSFPPPPGNSEYLFANLTYLVGLPVPADAGVTRATKEQEWTQLFGSAYQSPRLTDGRFEFWKAIGGYRVPNERNSAFGIAQGDRPKVSPPPSSAMLTWNPARTTRAHLDQLIDGLKDAVGNPITTGWKKGPAAGAPPVWEKGRDRPLVMMLCAGAQYGGTRTPAPEELITSALTSREGEPMPLQERLAPAYGGADIDPHPIPDDLPYGVGWTFAHELSHAFGMSDEYGDVGLSAGSYMPAVTALSLKLNGNLQPAEELEDPITSDLDANKLKTDIKWLWPRITKAGVLTKAPVASGSEFVVTLGDGQAEVFAKDDVVRLRRRPLVAFPQPSQRLQITQPPDTTTGEVRVKPLGTGFTAAPFVAGSVLICPRRPPDGPGGQLKDDYLLIAPIIHNHIQSQKSPLNRATGDLCGPPDAIAQTPVNLPTGMPTGRPRWSKGIVGLYDGGAGFDCNVFHPAGACLMRENKKALEGDDTFLYVGYPLCQVCRYLLVDVIDPTKHGQIDEWYEPSWPEP